ncbi:phosphoglycerate dehydrogenase [Helicobacter sp. 11S02629-2]|uniref:phosphoglycerate dehydrogenase n=1 Tax=Helicobacter sp. 11S02629-2 TaxID=1476195 RepID=UPI000BA79E82|nr:phosphoglycerate dehydrogenase [Helicobacter sp. 11S02629-2]PAF45334.1 phosphoglycerate dehydrogenase [Helicobacter sp. 11S02629-2]
MQEYHIIVCDHIHQKGIDLLKSNPDIKVSYLADMPKDELLKHIGDANCVITRSSTNVDSKFIEAAKNTKLKAIVRAGVGVDNVDIDECSNYGIVVMNIPTANTIAAVELTMTHMLCAIRRLPSANHQLKHDHIWKREDWYGTELKDKKLGIIGFGNIGSRVGKRAKAFEMDVLAYDPYIKASKALDMGVEYTQNFEDILKCDIITIHTPKNAQTKNMIDVKEIAKMKDGVILINCARGGLYNEDALYEGLKSKKIAFAGIDVFDKEPATSNKLLELDNIYVTPHIGANTLESQEKIALEAASAALSAVRGSGYPNALNLPTLAEDVPVFIKTYLELAQKLGFFAAQVVEGAISSINLEVSGLDLEPYVENLLLFATVGTLKPSLSEKVSHMNALFVAKNRSINVSSTYKQSANQFKNKLVLTLNTQKESISVSGTVYEDKILRFSNVNGFGMDLEPNGNIILFRNTDVPGVIGSVGNTIAKHKVNIADFRLGRSMEASKDKNEALALILVDNAVSKELLSELASIPECISVRYACM